MAGPTQPKVTDEVWDDERVKSFLTVIPPAGVAADFHRLLKAYRGMRPEDFSRFLGFFHAAGHDLDAADPGGRTLWQIISNHRHAGPFLAARESLNQQ